ncbi:hypothetical protein DFJ74DRAFT_702859 [Hyaloraphidium curvatum]|nr:hypothetical protein DFJ74DRAFT_702859 [Hyaloraphidium curvatum]
MPLLAYPVHGFPRTKKLKLSVSEFGIRAAELPRVEREVRRLVGWLWIGGFAVGRKYDEGSDAAAEKDILVRIKGEKDTGGSASVAEGMPAGTNPMPAASSDPSTSVVTDKTCSGDPNAPSTGTLGPSPLHHTTASKFPTLSERHPDRSSPYPPDLPASLSLVDALAPDVEAGKVSKHPLIRHVNNDDTCPCGIHHPALLTWTTPVPATFASLVAVSYATMLVFSSLSLVSASLPTLELSRRAFTCGRFRILQPTCSGATLPRSGMPIATARPRKPHCGSRSPIRTSATVSRPIARSDSRFSASPGRSLFVVLPVAGAIANVVAGSCIPACWLTPLLYFLYFFARELLAVAAANAQVSGTSAVLRRASREATALLARAAADGLSGTRAAKSLAWHAELLEKYAADQARAKVLGIEANWGSARAILIAVFTIAVGLWSVLRSSGVVLTLEIACPS